MKNNFNFNTWLENKNPEFYLSLIDEGFMPDWIRNAFLAGSIMLGPLLMSDGEVHGAEYKTSSEVVKTSEKSGIITIEVQIPLKIKNMEAVPNIVKSEIKNKLLLFLKDQEKERLEKNGPNLFPNLKEIVYVEVFSRPNISPVLTRFNVRELLPGWKSGDQDKLGRLLNVFIKPTEEEKKQGFHNLKFKIYYDKISQKKETSGDTTRKAPAQNNPTQSKIVK